MAAHFIVGIRDAVRVAAEQRSTEVHEFAPCNLAASLNSGVAGSIMTLWRGQDKRDLA